MRQFEQCFVVKDRGGQKLAYVYFDDEPGRRSAAKLLGRDEARRIALSQNRKPQAGLPLGAAELLPHL
jgi:hypothetical protein